MILATNPTYLVAQNDRTKKCGIDAHVADKDNLPVCGAQPNPGEQFIPSGKYLRVCRKCHEAIIKWLEDDPAVLQK